MCHETEETVISSILQNEEWIVQNSWSILWKYFGWSFNCTLKLSGLYLIVKSIEKLPIMSLLIIYFYEFKFVLDLGSHWSVRTGRICQVDPILQGMIITMPCTTIQGKISLYRFFKVSPIFPCCSSRMGKSLDCDKWMWMTSDPPPDIF